MDRVREGGEPRPLHPKALRVDVGHHEVAVAPEALPLGEEGAVLGHQEVAAEDEVGGGLVHARVGEHVGGEGPPRLLADQLAAVLRLGHEVGGGRGVQDHGRPRHRVAAAGGDGGPEVLADLDREGHSRLVRHPEEQLGAEGRGGAGQEHLALLDLAGRGEPALLVELVVPGQERLRHHPEQPPLLHQGGAVEEAAVLGHGQADRDHDGQARGLAEQTREGPFRAPDQGREAEEQVPAGVAGEGQLRQDEHLHSLGVGPPGEGQAALRVPLGVRHHHRRASRADPQEAVGRGGHATRIQRL